MPSPLPHYMLPTIYSTQTSARAATRAVVAASLTKVRKQVSRPAKAAPHPPPSTLTVTTFSARQRAVVAPKPTVATAPHRPIVTAPCRTVPRRTAAPVTSTASRPTVVTDARPSTLSVADRHRLYQLVPAIEEDLARAREAHFGEIRRAYEHKVLHGSYSFDSSVLTEVQVAESSRED
jgi:hypothetical protein